MRDDFAGIRAERDDSPEYGHARHSAPARRNGSLSLQVALGVWLGGVALGLTWFAVHLLALKTGLLAGLGL
ncbi:hypothetical protein [Pseudomonas sp. RIT-PI-AD]|uniref:hypothetical protein n=1 Tax=Pseudomonas sp. RIT-PI-AD TaxID=3035294 RepID=UPI0021DA5B03|nr:hypothetical protein [Pseudomonas sp. RIT-PI-AD]